METVDNASTAAMGDLDQLSLLSADVQQGSHCSLKDVTAAKCRNEWKDRMHHYGAVYNMMTGNTVSKSHSDASIAFSNSVDYCEELYHDELEKDVTAGTNLPHLEYGSHVTIDVHFTLPEYGRQQVISKFRCIKLDTTNKKRWFIHMSETSLERLTTFDIQSTISAALNSRRLLVWTIGINPNRMVTGCELNRTQRDIFQQAFDFCISTEFIPELLPSFVNIRFVKVSGVCDDRFVIEISTTCVTKQVFQLSSGRFFMCIKNEVQQMKNLNSVYQSMKQSCVSSPDVVTSVSYYPGFLLRDVPCVAIGFLAGYFLRRLF